jgi:hypothetical protein
MEAATQEQGADLQSAANAIESLLGASEEKRRPPTQGQESQQPAKAAKAVEADSHQQQEESAEEDVQIQEDSEALDDNQDADANYELPETAEQLAEALGIEPEKLQNLKLKTKVDGKEGYATLADLVKSYQLESHLTNKSMQMAEAKRQADAELTQARAYIQQQAENATAMVNFLNQELYRDFQNTNWDELRMTDPGEFAAKRQEFAERNNAIQQYQQGLAAHIQNQAHQQQTQQTETLKEYLVQQQNELMSKLPEWSTPEKAQAEKQEIRNFLVRNGFNQDETKNIFDHRHILIARKAMLYDKLQQSKPQITKKVQTLPKIMKANVARTKADLAHERQKASMAKLKKSGSLNDAAAAFLQRGLL